MRWIIGDIHGMRVALEKLLECVHYQDAAPQLFFCGDYVNRGPDSRGVVDLLLKTPNARFCRGNHDDTFDFLLSGKSYVQVAQPNGMTTTFDHFMKYGLEQTLLSYGVKQPTLDAARADSSPSTIVDVMSAVPPKHRAFFRSLPAVQEEKDFFVAHARWDVDSAEGSPSFDEQLKSPRARHDVIWGRFTADEINRHKPWTRTGFFGHTPVTMYRKRADILPIGGRKLVLIDTAAAVNLDGRLTAWCFEEDRYVQVHRDGERAL